MVPSRDDLDRRSRQPCVQGDEIGEGRRAQRALLAIGTSVGVVVIPVGPELDANRIALIGTRGWSGPCEGGAQQRDPSYSSQPHWIHRNGVSVSRGSPGELPWKRRE